METTTGAPTLKAACIKACIKNIRSITNVGCLEYFQIRPVLQKVTLPSHLLEIERNSPQIAGEDAELWQAFIRRDIPNWDSKPPYIPKDPTKWHKVYAKYKKEQQAQIKRDEEVLRASLEGIKKKKEGMVIAVVDRRSLPKLPRDSRMVANAGVLLKGKRSLFAKEGSSSLAWTKGSKTKVTDGKSVMNRVRREAAEAAHRARLARPAHQMVGRVQRAPEGMVNEYKRAEQPPVKILTQRKNLSSRLPATNSALDEREERLRKLTMQRPSTVPKNGEVLVGDTSDEESGDELFDEAPKRSANYSSSQLNIRSAAAASSSRPLSKPAPSSQPPPRSSSSTLSKPPPRNMNSSPAPQRSSTSNSSNSHPSGARRSPSPAILSKPPLPAPGPGPGLVRKRPVVDVFNRKVKRPRMT